MKVGTEAESVKQARVVPLDIIGCTSFVEFVNLSIAADIILSLSLDDLVRVCNLIDADVNHAATYVIKKINSGNIIPIIHFDKTKKFLF